MYGAVFVTGILFLPVIAWFVPMVLPLVAVPAAIAAFSFRPILEALITPKAGPKPNHSLFVDPIKDGGSNDRPFKTAA